MADKPSQIAVAVHVHRVWTAENERDRARAAYQAAIDDARVARIPINALKAAMRGLRRGNLIGLSADARAVVDAVQAVPMIGVEIEGLDMGAFSPTPPDETLSASTIGEAA